MKPVRSLDSLRPAWSGRLRHGPLPYSLAQNPSDIPPKPKSMPNPPPEVLSNQFSDLYSNKTCSNSQSSKGFLYSQLVDTTPLINNPSDVSKNIQTLHEYINPSNPFANNQILKSQVNGLVTDKEGEIKDKLMCSKDPFEADSSVKSSLQDPFDTSRVLIPLNPTFHSINHKPSINFYPSPTLNTELCSSHAKVNINTNFLFCKVFVFVPVLFVLMFLVFEF